MKLLHSADSSHTSKFLGQQIRNSEFYYAVVLYYEFWSRA